MKPFLQEEGMDILNFSAQSQGINPIENIW